MVIDDSMPVRAFAAPTVLPVFALEPFCHAIVDVYGKRLTTANAFDYFSHFRMYRENLFTQKLVLPKALPEQAVPVP